MICMNFHCEVKHPHWRAISPPLRLAEADDSMEQQAGLTKNFWRLRVAWADRFLSGSLIKATNNVARFCP